MTIEEESIEQAAISRRNRIKALRAAQALLSNDPSEDYSTQSEDANESSQEKNLNMKFRNYLPHDKELQEGKLDPPVLQKFEHPIAAAPLPSEKIEDRPFLNIAPKKPNWDLRRDVQKKLDKLERRTQKALYQIMLEQEKHELAMAEARKW